MITLIAAENTKSSVARRRHQFMWHLWSLCDIRNKVVIWARKYRWGGTNHLSMYFLARGFSIDSFSFPKQKEQSGYWWVTVLPKNLFHIRWLIFTIFFLLLMGTWGVIRLKPRCRLLTVFFIFAAITGQVLSFGFCSLTPRKINRLCCNWW